MKNCEICGIEYTGNNGKMVCGPVCLRAWHAEYQARIVEAFCSVCGKASRMPYSTYANNKRRRGGACVTCPDGDRAKARWEPVRDDGFGDEPLIKYRRPACGTCQHGTPEPSAWTGYKCRVNAAICQPALYRRLYVARRK